MSLVIDANVAIRITDASEAGHREAVAAYSEILDRGFEPLAPDVLLYEVGNFYRREGRARPQGFLDALQACELRQLTLEQAVRACGVASQARVAYSDVAYIVLAESEATWVWTEDREMLRKFPDRAVSTADVLARLRA